MRRREYELGEVIKLDGLEVRIAALPLIRFSLTIIDEDQDKIGLRDSQIRKLVEALTEYMEVKGL